ncbi:MAG: PQQ-like beta-propeller repeat protein [Planctomycetaceae bacterium]|nr:PQQ-like beta-propeller repeat protein [Planctomycetaceae bacterium]
MASLSLVGADWPQWRGLNRDGKVADFKVPAAWPAELKQKWDVIVGDGVATPALVGDRLYVHTREGSNEVVRCLNADTGEEIWKDEYAAGGAEGAARSFSGPRASPAVAEGKVVTIGTRGQMRCYDAKSGQKLWDKDDFKAWPRFFASASPIIVDGLVIAQLGAENNGTVAAYDLASGEQKWKWSSAPTSYSSPVLMTVDGTRLIIGQVGDGIVAINAADGKHVWEMYFETGGSRYKAATPIVDGNTLIYLDGPARAVKLSKEGDKFVSTKAWSNDASRVEYNTPVLKNGLLFGLSGRSELFCVDTKDGKTLWSAAIAPTPAAEAPAPSAPAGGFGGKGKGRGMGGGQGGYGSVVDAGEVLFALTPSSQLVVYEPSDKEFKKLASYKVGDKATYAYPIIAGNRIYIKDADSVTLWTVE